MTLLKRVPLLVTALATSAFAQYSVTDLGPAANTYSIFINNNGVIGGTDVNGRAFRWTNGSIDTFAVPGYDATVVQGINSSGQMAGFALSSGPAVAMRITGSTVQSFAGPTSGETSFTSLNDAGVSAGTFRRQVNNLMYNTPATLVGSTWTQLPFPNSSFTDGRADSINANGMVAGVGHDSLNGYDRALLWVGGSVTLLTSPDASRPECSAELLNDNGDLILSAHPIGGSSTSWYLRRNGSYTPLVGPGGAAFGVASLKNDLTMVGVSTVSGSNHGFLRRPDASYFDLTSFMSGAVGASGFTPGDINDSGQIVGLGFVGLTGRYYLLNPVPEPASFVFLSIGLLLVQRRRKR